MARLLGPAPAGRRAEAPAADGVLPALRRPGPAADAWWRHGCFWSISTTPPSEYGALGEPLLPDSEAAEMNATAVRLKAMPPALRRRLVN